MLSVGGEGATNQRQRLLRPNIDVDSSATMTARCDLDFDLQYLIQSSVGASEYSPPVLSQLFMRYCGNNICEDEQQTWRMESQKHKAFADSVSRVLNA